MANIPQNYEAYLRGLPIPREPTIKNLSSDEIATITKTVFIPNQIRSADLLFIFGTSTISEPVWQTVAAYFQQNHFRQILVTGLVGRAYYETGRPLAHILQDKLLEHGIPSDAIFVQAQSTNTLEDVKFSLDLWPHLLRLKRVMFLAKAHHSGRCLRTLRKFFPKAQLNAFTYNAAYEGVVVSAQTWHTHPISISRVYGEYLRIKKYAAQGDIAP